MRPLIGIPTRTVKDETVRRFAVLDTYCRGVELAGGAPIGIPLELSDESLQTIFSHLDGLLLAGGVDIDPNEYGEELEDFCGDIEPARDATELTLTRWALNGDKPILGICRGIQLLNVAAGGSLYQDVFKQLEVELPHQHEKGEPYNLLKHSVKLDPDSRVARALGDNDIKVNSLHHQALKQVAPRFRIVGRASDGIVEAIESADERYVVGVQFHPEWMLDDDRRMLNLFRDFVKASAQDKESIGRGQ